MRDRDDAGPGMGWHRGCSGAGRVGCRRPTKETTTRAHPSTSSTKDWLSHYATGWNKNASHAGRQVRRQGRSAEVQDLSPAEGTPGDSRLGAGGRCQVKGYVTPILMDHASRRRLIESPILIRVIGRHTWGGCSVYTTVPQSGRHVPRRPRMDAVADNTYDDRTWEAGI